MFARPCTIHSLFRLQGPHFLRPAGAQRSVISALLLADRPIRRGGATRVQGTEFSLETKGQRLKGPSVAVNSPKCVNRRETAQSRSYNLCPFPHDGCFYHLQLQSFGAACCVQPLSEPRPLPLRCLYVEAAAAAPSPGGHHQDF